MQKSSITNTATEFPSTGVQHAQLPIILGHNSTQYHAETWFRGCCSLGGNLPSLSSAVATLNLK
eukprot:scaffold187637_cov37-Prasinocladus_malaysianus.AAC.1